MNLAEVVEVGRSLFPLGEVRVTKGALDAFVKTWELPLTYLVRHEFGDWGEVDEQDGQANWVAVDEGLRILSAYTLEAGAKIWIITEADRSATTILLPDEY